MGNNKKILLHNVNTYKRNHSVEYFGDVEKSKVQRDKMKLRKVENEIKKALPAGGKSNITDEEIDYLEEAVHASQKARGGVNTHNKRYKNLSRHEDFQ